MIVSNATPLIYLAKIGKSELLKDLFGKIYVSEQVKLEIVDNGKLLGKKDSYIIEKAIKDGWIIVMKAKAQKIPIPLDAGEESTICLALQKKASIVLIDEASARTAAKLMGLKPLGTAGVLLSSLKKRKIKHEEFLSLIENLLKEGFRLKHEVYFEILSQAEKYR